MTRLLVLGGTAFVGRAVVEAAVARGWRVTTFSRGVTGTPPPGVEALTGDRTAPGGHAPLAGREWDVVVDTWRDVPAAVEDSTRLLAGAVGRYAYVSSLAVYRWPPPAEFTEDAPLVDHRATSGDDFDAYGLAKAAAEHAVRAAFGDRALLARTGLILGRYEYVGRLPWWLARTARGGRTLAPAPPDRPLQYVDCRDLADWLLAAADRGLSGPVNVLGPPGLATMRTLLEACREVTGGTAELVWVPEGFLLERGLRPWSELPVWVPERDRLAASYAVRVDRAARTGLVPRPVADTVADTWAWLRGLDPADRDRAAGLGKPWLAPDREAALLAAWAAAGHQSG